MGKMGILVPELGGIIEKVDERLVPADYDEMAYRDRVECNADIRSHWPGFEWADPAFAKRAAGYAKTVEQANRGAVQK